MAIKDHLINFVSHVTRIGTSFVVGAVDAGAFELLAAQRTPVYKTPLAHQSYALDGANSHSSRSWQRFAAMRTGEVARVVALGYDVLHTDTDVVWLRDPTPYLMCTPAARSREFASSSPFPCEPMLRADVAVSSDNMGPGRAKEGGAAYHAAGTFNSGILLFRASRAGTRFAAEWHANVARPIRGSRFYGKTSDQQVFNAMVRKERQWPGVGARRKEWLMRKLHEDWMGAEKNFTLGALPLPLFANGHGYFVQSAHTSLGVKPFAVHATYSLDAHDGLAKQQRFREAGLWHADTEGYFRGKFLAINASTPPSVAAAIDHARRKGQTPYNIGVHRSALIAYLAELRDALALAVALQRTLVLPPWLCYCDKLWAGSDNILGTKCMYPGSQDHPFLPFGCPMDHVLSPRAWTLQSSSKVAYRDASFLTSPRLPPEVSRSTADVAIVSNEAALLALPMEQQKRALARGTTAADAAKHLDSSSLRDVAILRLPHTRGLLCGMGSRAETNDFNALARPLLRAPPWCARCDRGTCRRTLEQWLSPSEMGRVPAFGGEWCMRTPTPPPFQHGRCVLNE